MKQGGRPRRSEEQPDSPFGEALKEHLRRVKDFTQAELAREGFIPEKTLSQMVKGKRTSGPALRRDLRAIIKVLYQKKALQSLEEANLLIRTIPAIKDLDERDPDDAKIIALFNTPVAAIERVVLIEDRIQGILRNNAVVDHTQLFGVDTFIEKIKDDISAPQAAFSWGKGANPTLEIGDPAARVIAEADV